MSVYNPVPLASIVNGFPPTMRTPGLEGQSWGERQRAALDYLFERMFRAASDSSGLPLDATPINPSAFALFNQVVGAGIASSGIVLGQLRRRDYDASMTRIAVGGSLPQAEVARKIEAPAPTDAIPLLAWTIEFDDPSYPVGPFFPEWSWRDSPTPGLYVVFKFPALSHDGDGAFFNASASLWEIGSDGSGFTSGGVVSTPTYDVISDAAIAADAKAYASLLRSFRNRMDYLKNCLDGQTDAAKIVAQAIPMQASGSGQGLSVKMFNYRKFTATSIAVAAGGSQLLSTSQLASVTLAPLQPLVYSITGSNYDVRARTVQQPVSANPTNYVLLENKGSGAATVSVDQYLLSA